MAQARRKGVLLLFAILASGAGQLATWPGPTAAARKPSRTVTLPESVLAVVGGGRQITRSRFLAAWKQVEPPARPDSLTPQGASRFLRLLVGKEALGEAALGQHWTWTDDDSSEYRGLRDRLVMKAELDSALDATRRTLAARGDSISDPRAIGVVARDSLVARLHPRYDDALLERVAKGFAAVPRPSPDSSLTSQLRLLGLMPRVDSLDRARPLVRTDAGDYTVAELLDAWRHFNPLYRPRIDTAEQVRDLVRNGLYERELRRDAVGRRIEEWPEVAAALARQREYVAVSHLVARNVYARIAEDSVTLRRHYAAHLDRWALPLRVALTRLVFADRASATRMALTLREEAEADSLVARASRGGVDYRTIVSEESDSTLFRRALRAGAGAVLGPDSSRGGWGVARVAEVLPGRDRSFAEARTMVHHEWYGQEGERLMVALLDSVRAATPVTVNTRALARLLP
jgi:hypothetical protein